MDIHPFVESKYIKLTSSQKNMIAGGIAGCIAKTTTAPLSKLTILKQVDPMFMKTKICTSNSSITATVLSYNSNIFSDLRNMCKNKGGIRSLWSGNLTAVIHRFPYSAINFSAFEASNKFLSKYINGNSHETMTTRFLSGSFAGAMACIACYPLDLVRTRLTVDLPKLIDSKNKTSYSNNNTTAITSNGGDVKVRLGGKIFDTVKQIVKEDGLQGLYRGLPISLLVSVSTLGISFSVYGFIKSKLIEIGGIYTIKHTHRSDVALSITHTYQLSPIGSLLSGCLSGVVSSLVTFPLDVVKKRMQMMCGSNQAMMMHQTMYQESHTIVSMMRKIWLKEGHRGFYGGISAELMKVCPQVAIMYCSYEMAQNFLRNHC